MKQSSVTVIRAFAVAAFAIAIVGCMPLKSDHPYQPGPDEAIPVPPGAQIIAFGHYPVGPFVIPHESGNLYVWDQDAGKMAYMSTTGADSASQPTDLNQISKNSFDPTHNYRVYFVPSAAVMITTQPAGTK